MRIIKWFLKPRSRRTKIDRRNFRLGRLEAQVKAAQKNGMKKLPNMGWLRQLSETGWLFGMRW